MISSARPFFLIGPERIRLVFDLVLPSLHSDIALFPPKSPLFLDGLV